MPLSPARGGALPSPLCQPHDVTPHPPGPSSVARLKFALKSVAVVMSRPAAPLMLTDDDRLQLARMCRRGRRGWRNGRGSCWRARSPAGGNCGVAAELGLTTGTVRKWRSRFAEAGLDGLADMTGRGGRRQGWC